LNFQAIFILALVNYENLTYHNGKYIYPGWAHAIGWCTVTFTVLCIPGYAVFNVYRAEGASLSEVRVLFLLQVSDHEFSFQKIRNTIKPNIYECKICNEHHCEHDFPEECPQELSSVFSASPIILQPPPMKVTQSPRPTKKEEKPGNGQGRASSSKAPSDEKVSKK
jgi:solute carrier family 6 (neurotransmitter transporter, taurine) member 6